MAQPPSQSDWTHGPAKWAAVLVLGGASITGMAWSLTRQPRPIYAPAIVQREAEPASPPRQTVVHADSPAVPPPLVPTPNETPEPEPPVSLLAIPAEPAAPVTIEAPPPEPAASLARVININTATAAELELLPGIGPALAARIVEYRGRQGRFRSVDELDHVSGIGPRTLEKIRPHATVK